MKKTCGAVQLFAPSPIVLVGTLLDGKANFTTVGDVAIMGVRPPLIYISLHTRFCSTAGIRQNGFFSINVPPAGLVQRVDQCGVLSGWNSDKATLFTVITGETGAPLIQECPLNLECRVINEFAVQHRQGFIGEIIETHVDEDVLVDTANEHMVVDTARLNPILYGLDNYYYRLGERIGEGYQTTQ